MLDFGADFSYILLVFSINTSDESSEVFFYPPMNKIKGKITLQGG